jgi:hypothetical protein
LFYDKVANVTTITNILDNLLDLHYPKQFTAVAYCLCQLSKVETSCEVLIDCSVLPIVLGFIRSAPLDSIDYLWNVIVNITQYEEFFPKIMEISQKIIEEIYEEIRFDSSSLHQQISITKIAYHLSKQIHLKDFLNESSIEIFIKSLKILFSSRRKSNRNIQISCLISLTHFAYSCTIARSFILSNDLIDLFYEVGIDDAIMNVKYVGLLNIISNEENCCYRLLELQVQKFLVSLQDSFQKLTDGGLAANNTTLKKPRKVLKQSSTLTAASSTSPTRRPSAINEPISPVQAALSRVGTAPSSAPSGSLTGGNLHKGEGGDNSMENDLHPDFDPAIEGELGKAHTAAILHNLALKRPILQPGTLTMMLALAKNCKALRVLHIVRALANMSVHSKSKLAISKESKKIFPMLTVIMRCGCEEAERVQYFCAIVLCNILALSLEKNVLFELLKVGAVVDLIVVTLLRINAIKTKEILGKAFFNLLSRLEIRENLILQVDILAGILELPKIEYVDLLELCIRALYNVTCDLIGSSGNEYALKLAQLKVPSLMIQRLLYTPELAGSMTTRPIRLLLGMSLANMSFNRLLVYEIAKNEGKIADALYRVYVLATEESTFCSLITLYNLSQIPECKVLADSKAVTLLVEVLESTENKNFQCIQLCIATICNFSKLLVFHEQLTGLTIKSLINILSSPSLHISVKREAVQSCYNLATLYPPSRIALIQHDAISALWKLMKISGVGGKPGTADGKPPTSGGGAGGGGAEEEMVTGNMEADDEEYMVVIIGRLVKELCYDVSDILTLRKLLSDGIMGIILKLAKIELVDAKVS